MVPLPFHAVGFDAADLHLLNIPASQSSVMWWPDENALMVADLHLEKGSFYAGTGQMLPPYDSRVTLERLAEAIRITGARRLFALGDNFHDIDGPGRLDPHAAGMLGALTRALDWVWITGNHDERLPASIGGSVVDEIEIRGIALRHRVNPDCRTPEVSGHFHPKLRITVRGRRMVRPCAVRGGQRLILPAFGAYTGGMDARADEIIDAMRPAREIEALVATKSRILRYPLWQAAA